MSDAVQGKAPSWKKALGMGAAGSLVGLGVRHGTGALTRLANKFPTLGKHMLDQSGHLARGYADLGWMVDIAIPTRVHASLVRIVVRARGIGYQN